MKFYTREQIEPVDIIELIRLWEIGAGESFFDYCTFHRSIEERMMKFLEEHYPSDYEFVIDNHNDFDFVDGFDWIDFLECSQLLELCYINDYNQWSENDYRESLLPLAEFIWLDNDAWETLEEFFMEDGTVDTNGDDLGYLYCYNIKEDFDDYLNEKENENE